MHNEGDTLEDYYTRAHLDETRRKFLDGLKEGRENSPVEENRPVMEKQNPAIFIITNIVQEEKRVVWAAVTTEVSIWNR